MSMAAIIGAVAGMIPPNPDDNDDDRRKPPAPKTPPPRPSGADIARDLVNDVKDPVPDTEDALQR